MRYSAVIASILLASSQLVAGHGAIVKAVGDQGGNGSAIGIDPATPRDGTKRNPFQADSTRFKGDAADTCGETVGAGDNEIEGGVKAVMKMSGSTLPQVSQGGEITMTLHQVNGDGAGPYTCMADASGTGEKWVKMEVTTNVPGQNSRSNAKATDFPLKATMPDGMSCTGTVAGQENVCLVRCQNAARAGPFGGCVPVQMSAAVAAAGNATTAKAANTVKVVARDGVQFTAQELKELLADGEDINDILGN